MGGVTQNHKSRVDVFEVLVGIAITAGIDDRHIGEFFAYVSERIPPVFEMRLRSGMHVDKRFGADSLSQKCLSLDNRLLIYPHLKIKTLRLDSKLFCDLMLPMLVATKQLTCDRLIIFALELVKHRQMMGLPTMFRRIGSHFYQSTDIWTIVEQVAVDDARSDHHLEE